MGELIKRIANGFKFLLDTTNSSTSVEDMYGGTIRSLCFMRGIYDLL